MKRVVLIALACLLCALLLGCKATPVNPIIPAPVDLGPTKTITTLDAVLTVPVGWNLVPPKHIPEKMKRNEQGFVRSGLLSPTEGTFKGMPWVDVSYEPGNVLSVAQFNATTEELLKGEVIYNVGNRAKVLSVTLQQSPKGDTTVLECYGMLMILRTILTQEGRVHISGYVSVGNSKMVAIVNQIISTALPAPNLKLL